MKIQSYCLSKSGVLRHLIFIVFIFGFTTLKSKAQDIYTFNGDNQRLTEVLQTLEQTYPIYFSFKQSDVESVRITSKIESSDIDEFLNNLLDGTALDYSIVDGNFIVLTKQDQSLKFKLVCGYVKDGLSDIPLQGANILLSNSGFGTSTNSEGYFELEVNAANNTAIDISYIGYQTQSIESVDGQDCNTYTLSLDDTTIPYLVITDYVSDGIALDSDGATSKLSPRKMSMLPGQVDSDVLKAVSFLPGVSSPTSASSDIRIRGGSPDQNLILWESIPIYHSAHYFGMITAFNPHIISSVNVHRGGFGPEYGGRVAGVIDMKSRDLGKTFVGAGIDMLNAYLYGSQRFGKNKNSSLTFSVRRSYDEVVETPTLNNITQVNQQGLLLGARDIELLPDHITIDNDFSFFDAQIQYSSQLSKQWKLNIAGTYATNDFIGEIRDVNRNEDQRDSMMLDNKGLSVSLTRKTSGQSESEIKLIGTAFEQTYNYRLKGFNQDIPSLQGTRYNNIQDLQLQASHKHQFNPKQSIEAGYHLIDYTVAYQVIRQGFNQRPINDEKSDQSQLHAIYSDYKHSFGKGLSVDLGLRASYFQLKDKMYLEPRIRVDWRLNTNVSINGYLGRHQQYISQLSVFRGSETGISTPLWILSDRNDVPVQQSTIGQLGALYTKGSWVVDVQAYTRHVSGLSSRAYDFDAIPDNVPLVGSADIMGLDILIKKRFKHLRSWFSYSLSENLMNFPIVSKDAFSSDFNQKHVVQFTNQLILGRFQCSLGYKYGSGLPYSELLDFEIESMPGDPLRYKSIYGSINSQLLGSLQELNASVQYQLSNPEKKWKGYLSASVTNLLNTTNIYARNYSVDYVNGQPPAQILSVDKSNLKFTPNVSLRVEF